MKLEVYLARATAEGAPAKKRKRSPDQWASAITGGITSFPAGTVVPLTMNAGFPGHGLSTPRARRIDLTLRFQQSQGVPHKPHADPKTLAVGTNRQGRQHGRV